jgi:hypothetical protein
MSLALAADPTSNRIVGVFGEGNSDDDVGVSPCGRARNWSDTAEMTLTGLAQSQRHGGRAGSARAAARS